MFLPLCAKPWLSGVFKERKWLHNCVRMQGRTVEKLRQSGNAVIEWEDVYKRQELLQWNSAA